MTGKSQNTCIRFKGFALVATLASNRPQCEAIRTMADNADAGRQAEPIVLTALSKRDIRALTEQMEVHPERGLAAGAESLYVVESQSGAEYLIDTLEQVCNCPDSEYRQQKCKHIRRVEYWLGERPIPTAVEVDEIDHTLRERGSLAFSDSISEVA